MNPIAADPVASGSESDTLIDLVAQALHELRSGRAPDVDALCAARPELKGAVHEALGLARGLPIVADIYADPLLHQCLGGRYRVQARLGAGAMGAVYRAHDQELRRDVAVKVLQPGLLDSATASERLRREAEVLARLRHPGIVAVHDRGRTAHGLAYVVMELVEGTPLSVVVAQVAQALDGNSASRAFTDQGWLQDLVGTTTEVGYLRQAVRWTAELAEALHASHQAGVCHRDVKPSNVMVRRDGRPVLLDFGIASGGDGALTATGSTLGTPWYMSPEAARGERTPHPAQDIWSLAATLFHLLAGRPPFEGDSARVLWCLQTDLPPSLAVLRPDLPRDLGAIVEHALDPLPHRRYADAAAFAADLRAFLEHRPVAARPRSALQRQWSRLRRAPAKALASASVVLAVVAVGLGFVVRQQSAAAQARNRGERQRALIATLPASLAIDGNPDSRLVESTADRAATLALLDEILALGEDLPTRLLRAALRLDQGDHAAAADDLRHLQALAHSPYLSAVAKCFAAADTSKRGVLAVQLGELPRPQTAVDKFVAGFHALRGHDLTAVSSAEQLLAEAGGTFTPARDLRLMALLSLAQRASDPDQARAWAQTAHDEALVLVGLHGKTARTQHAIATACILLRRYADAEQPLRESITMRPGRSGPLTNLGIVLHRLGRLDEATELLEQALTATPPSWNARHTLALIACERRQFERAVAWTEQIPDADAGRPVWQKPYLRGHIAVTLADDRLAAGDRTSAQAAAVEALTHYAAAVQAGCGASRTAIGVAYAQALVHPSEDTLIAFLGAACADADNPVHVRNVAFLLPDAQPLRADTVEALREFLAAQAVRLSPDRSEQRAFLDRVKRR